MKKIKFKDRHKGVPDDEKVAMCTGKYDQGA